MDEEWATVEAYLVYTRKDAVRHNPFMLKLKNWIKAMQKPYCNCAVKRGVFSVVLVRESCLSGTQHRQEPHAGCHGIGSQGGGRC